jgi:hypothetical protein
MSRKPSVTSSAVSGLFRSTTAFITTVWRGACRLRRWVRCSLFQDRVDGKEEPDVQAFRSG